MISRLLTRSFITCLLLIGAPVHASDRDESWPQPVGAVELQSAGGPGLDVGIVVFDAGIPADVSTRSKLGVFPSIREAEARYMPVLLRQALQDSGAWGVVRVLPEAQESSELLVSGRILHSDGLRLAVRITARDATGRTWLERTYLDEAEQGDYLVPASGVPREPYADLYRSIANDLLATGGALAQQELAAIRQVGLLRYAAGLSPEAFGSYLTATPEGRYAALRLPAQGDPMMGRVNRIRNQEYLFVDTVDEQYLELYETMAPTYFLWRQYGREQAIYLQDYQQRAENRSRHGRRGSYAAMEQTYYTYRSLKIQSQDLVEMAGGFRNEVAPTVMEVSGKVFRLDGTLDSQYAEWRDILRQIFTLETGL